jgi:amino acid adenylation domain-containing protein
MTSAMSEAPELYRFPTTFSQRQLWYVQATAPQTTAYNIPFAFTLRGALDVSALERAVAELVARHDALRTVFEVHGEEVRQVVDMALTLSIEHIDLSAIASAARAQALAEQRARIACHVFDLARPPLLVLRLLKLGESEHVLLLCVHHIVMDHLSVLAFGQELSALYADYRQGRTPAAPAEGLQYPDYAVWQAEALDTSAIEHRLPHWIESLAGFPHQLELPTDHPRPPLQSFEGEELRVAFSPELSRALRAFAQAEQQTLFTVVLAGLGLLMRGYTGQDRVIVGCPFANRGAEELESVMGLFMNLLPVGLAIDPQQGFSALVREARRQMMKAQGVQDTPFEKIVQALGVQRDAARNPLVQAWYTFQDAPMALALDGLEVDSEPLPNGGAKLDLSFWFWDDGARIQGLIEFDSALFERASIERLAARLERVLAQAVATPQQPVARISLIADSERERLEAMSAGPAPARDWCSPHAAFFERAQREPGAIVLEAADGHFSAAELAARADALAEALQARGVAAGDIVGVALSRRSDLVAALLGVLRAGAAWLPLDPELPVDRLRYMREDAGAALVMVDADSAGLFDSAESLSVETVARTPGAGFAPAPEAPDSLAYVIYTSGSTGKPKGVRIPRRAVGNFLAAMADAPGLAPGQRLLALTTCAFDISVLELLLPLAAGGCVVLGQRALLEAPGRLAAALREQRIDVFQATPSTWRLLRAEDWGGQSNLMALTGGEALTPELAQWLCPRVDALWNLYGPTETTVWSSLQRIEAETWERCPIGRPIASTGLHVVDAELQRLPCGLPGELLITGAGLAEGYHARPELTAEKFVTLPENGQRAYRTGDIALRLPTGELLHLGRRDHQVKLRGYRIELGEIEAALCAHPRVESAVVAVHGNEDDQRLLAWVVGTQPEPTPAELRAHLASRLPAYMLPQQLLSLPSLPLLPNGKLDRARLPLPQPGTDGQAGDSAASAALSPTALTLLAMARELLGTSDVQIGDNFFDAGGHSLLALTLATRVEKQLGVKLSLLAIAQSSLGALAAQIDSAEPGSQSASLAAEAQRSQRLGARVARLFGFGR